MCGVRWRGYLRNETQANISINRSWTDLFFWTDIKNFDVANFILVGVSVVSIPVLVMFPAFFRTFKPVFEMTLLPLLRTKTRLRKALTPMLIDAIG